MKIDASEKSLEELFIGNNVLTIPEYQRNYAWKSDQIDAFWEDVVQLASPQNEEHFFGPLVLLEQSDNKYSVIDGQQRITTVVMLLSIIRDKLEDDFENSKMETSGDPEDLLFYITQLLKLQKNSDDRYMANYQIRDVFNKYVLISTNNVNRRRFGTDLKGLTSDQKRATTELRSAYTRLNKKLTDWLSPNAGDELKMKKQLRNLIFGIKSGFRLLVIKMFSEDDAYLLFETLNERGLRLTASDLLKSFTLRLAKQHDPTQLEDVLRQWDDTVLRLNDFPFTSFLRHYLLAAQDQKVQQKKIFKLFSEIVSQYGENGAVRNLQDLNTAAAVYSKLLIEDSGSLGNELDSVFSRINQFSQTHRVFLLRVMLGKYSDGAKMKAARATEMLAFRWIVTGGNAQELETIYQDSSTKLRDGLSNQNQDEHLNKVVDEMLSRLPNDKLVLASMSENPARKDLQQYVLKRVNFAITGVGLPHSPKSIHVEHIAPQNPAPDSDWLSSIASKGPEGNQRSIYEDYVNKWGNLTLLEYEINTSVGNSEWDVKRAGIPAEVQKGLSDSLIKITKDVVKNKSWGHSEIDQRTQWIAESMIKLTHPENLGNDVLNLGDPITVK